MEGEGLLTGIGLLYIFLVGIEGGREREEEEEKGVVEALRATISSFAAHRTPARDPANDFSAFACI